MKFSTEWLQDLLWDDVKDGKTIKDTISYNDRWTISYELTFEYNEKYYRTHYRRGATEYQDESPFEYDDDSIECPEVFKVEKTITVFQETPNES